MTFGQINYIWDVKRIASTLLLSIFLYNIVGYYFSFSVLDLQNRSLIEKLMQNESTLQTLRIHKSEIKNIVFQDDDQEMSYNGEMYDIKDRSQDGDYIVFHCINDKNESELIANLDKHVQNNIDPRSSSEQKQHTISNTILKDYFISRKQDVILSSEELTFPSAICHLPSYVFLSLASPPPRIA